MSVSMGPGWTRFAVIPRGPDRKSTRLNSSHSSISYAVFCFNDTATTEIYTLSLHDALPIFGSGDVGGGRQVGDRRGHLLGRAETAQRRGRRLAGGMGAVRRVHVRVDGAGVDQVRGDAARSRSEEHTSELQSQFHLVCRLLL